ncbi:putative phage abortive infection protein [Leeuwenhoekiella palythoae]|uniref:putative phage abortive infection protein n=1 Tax=Leeuwenhoekiella palythoae TaxID=573501 RepID=UPI003519410A
MRSYFDKNNEDGFYKDGVKYLALASGFIIIILGIAVVGVSSNAYGSIGDLGSFLSGSIGVIVALLVGVFTYLAFYAQFEANKKIQDQFEHQKVESQFYTMLNLHLKNIDGFEIQEYLVSNQKSLVDQSTVHSRRVFLPMITELHEIIKIVYMAYGKLMTDQLDNLNKLAYQIFFFGVKSSHVKPLSNTDTTFKDLINALINYQNQFRKSRSKNRVYKCPFTNNTLEIRLRYIPFAGHESRLAHYYRHLYQTVKQVVEAEKKDILDYKDSRRLLATLRAQLSNQEQLLLYYNYRSTFGDNWDKLGSRGHQFFSKYRMIHNIPLDDNRLIDAFEHPRDHFKDFIKNNTTSDDPLFEWGDY